MTEETGVDAQPMEPFDFCRLPLDIRTMIISHVTDNVDKCKLRYACRQLRDDVDQFSSWKNASPCLDVTSQYVRYFVIKIHVFTTFCTGHLISD
jgi:hypothetical protein